MFKRHRAISLVIMATMLTTGINAVELKAIELTSNAESSIDASTSTADSYKPKQVNVHMGEDPSTQVNVTYTTVAAGQDTKIVLNKVGDSKEVTVQGECLQGNADKYFHMIAVKDLEPATQYEYTVGSGENTFKGTFKTAPAKGSKAPIKFAYIADTQVSNADNAKALGATLAEIAKDKSLDFVYMAGDTTDKATSEAQWEYLFNNDGAFPTGGQDMFGSKLVSVVQGNHDNNTLTRHINAPAEMGNIVYSYDYGPVTFVMLNLETARYDADARSQQKEYLTKVVKEAKERGQWTMVGFHKSLYTGASHITDSDVIEARNYWAPIFADLDVDVVMQGHDHVYSRGFVNEDGYNAKPEVEADGDVIDPANAPLYMVGGHAGGLKWYSKKNYTVGAGDRLAPGYSFLDVNSTDTGSDIKKEQVIVEMEASEDELKLNTYMFKYDTATDTITTDKYLYDTLTVVKNNEDSEYAARLNDVDNVEGKAGTEFKVPVIVNKMPTDQVIRSAEMTFDIPDDLEVADVELNNKAISANNWDYNVDNGKLRVALANLDNTPIFINNVPNDKEIVTLTLKLKEDKNQEDTTKVKMTDLIFRCQDNLDITYGTAKANSTISFKSKGVSSVTARELYESEGIDVIPENMKAVATEFTLVDANQNVKFGDTDFYYSPEFTDKSGKTTYVALVDKDTKLEELSDISKYQFENSESDANKLTFGDINNDGIDAQDALTAVGAWLRKNELSNKEMLSVNVSGDGKINTRDAIDIIDYYVDGKGFAVLTK